MAAVPVISEDLQRLLAQMESFEAPESVTNRGAGFRREGAGFEKLTSSMWHAFRQVAEAGGAQSSVVAGTGTRRYAKLSIGARSMFVPASAQDWVIGPDAEQSRWLEVAFGVDDLIAAFPTRGGAIRKYAPESGPYAGEQYPTIYSGLSTKFDDTIVLVDGGVLREKILLEYKTAKSSDRRQIDGNAHERLSFQMMQYLEVATRYTKCSLMVMANGAFVRYRNKYHVNFHVQVERLTNFSWFSMEHACTASGYARFLSGLLSWLFEGSSRFSGKQESRG